MDFIINNNARQLFHNRSPFLIISQLIFYYKETSNNGQISTFAVLKSFFSDWREGNFMLLGAIFVENLKAVMRNWRSMFLIYA
jgi:hypothetical protein